MLGQKLRDFARQHGIDKTVQFLREAITPASGDPKDRKIHQHQISLRNLVEGFLGPAWNQKLERYQQGLGINLMEAEDAMDASAFSQITGQLLVDTVKAKYETAEKVGLGLVETVPITNGNLGTYKEPFLSDILDAPPQLQPGMPYPHTIFNAQYITFPAPKKQGHICNINFEMLFSDLTRQAYESAENVGERIAIWQEEEILNTVMGLSNTFNWNGTTYNTYLTSGTWTNSLGTNPLLDWTSLNSIEQLSANMLNPVTLKPINIKPTALLCVPYLYYQAKRVLHATETRSAGATTAAWNQVAAPNPIEMDYPIVKSKFAYNQLITATAAGGGGLTATQAQAYFWLGDFKRAFVWRQVYPLTAIQAPPQAPASFNQDITLQVKASIFGVAGVRDPRYSFQSFNT